VSTLRDSVKGAAHPRFEARLRTGCDLMNTFFVYDEYSDVAHEDEVQVLADIITNALCDPHTPQPQRE
jgi:hypothetical protein